ncbi:cytochrome P450 [Mycena filopes]|nr:cytochrome P450 [Mycena filopes]
MLLAIIKCALLLWLCYVAWLGLRRIFGGSVLDNIPGPPSESFLAGCGTSRACMVLTAWDFHKSLEEDFNGVVKIHGLIGDVQLYVFDPAALHSILVKDQELYEESTIFLSLTGLLFGKGILSTTGKEHRRHRKILMPAFSTKNLRRMLPRRRRATSFVMDSLIPTLKAGPRELDMYSILSRTSLEFVGRAGVGYSFRPAHVWRRASRSNTHSRSRTSRPPSIHKLAVFLPLLPLASRIGPASFRRFVLRLIPSQTLAALCRIVNVMDSKAKFLVRDKNRNGEATSTVENSNDIMSLLLRSNKTAAEGMTFIDAELVAQISMIIHAGTDTTSSALNRIIHLLALHSEVQEKLRGEIIATAASMGHDELVGLPYLDGVVRETLRLYPPVTAMTRTCSIPVPKGCEVTIAISAANHNKGIWGADALEFRPERWVDGRARGVTVRMSGVYGNMMTFVGGGRSCIGFKFVQLELSTSIY